MALIQTSLIWVAYAVAVGILFLIASTFVYVYQKPRDRAAANKLPSSTSSPAPSMTRPQRWSRPMSTIGAKVQSMPAPAASNAAA